MNNRIRKSENNIALINAISRRAQEFFEGNGGSHGWDHTQRVRKIALRIGKIEKANLEIIEIAAILHDIARDVQDKSDGREDHAKIGAILASEILNDFGLGTEKISRIVHCIESHRYRSGQTPQSIEAKVLYDADKLDGIGAVGIVRAAHFAGKNGAKVHNNAVDIENTLEYTDEDTLYREYLFKMRYVKDKMLTTEGRVLAQKRHDFMIYFFEEFLKEMNIEA